MKLLRNRWARGLAATVALLAVVWVAMVAFLWFNVRKAGEARLAHVVAELDATDPGWRTVDLEAAHNAAVAPPEQNAGEQALAAIALLPKEYTDYAEKSVLGDKITLPHLPHPDDMATLRHALDHAAPALEIACTLRRLPGGGFRGTFKEPNPFSSDFHSFSIWKASYLLWSETILRAADNRGDDALDTTRCIFALDRAIGDEPTLISQMSRLGYLRRGAECVEWTLACCSTSTNEKLAELQSEILSLTSAPRLKTGLRGHRAVGSRVFENLDTGKLDPDGWPHEPRIERDQLDRRRPHLPGLQAEVLECCNLLLGAVDAPYFEQKRAFEAVQARTEAVKADRSRWPVSMVMYSLLDSMPQVAAQNTRIIGLFRATATAVACERYRLKHGRFPTVLAELSPDFMTAIPADPYTGEPLRYRRTASGVVIYTVGANGIDNGGVNLDPMAVRDGDIGFRLFDPPHRRQPPLPLPLPKPDDQNRP